VLVDRGIVAEEDPLGAFVLFVLDQLEVYMGRVIHDHDDLGLGIEVRPGAGEELVHIEASEGWHGREATHPGAPLAARRAYIVRRAQGRPILHEGRLCRSAPERVLLTRVD
jgi:hypothetical protein